MSSIYWKEQLDYYTRNGPPKAESFYNQTFVDQINKARADIDGLVGEKDKAWSAQGQAADDYNAFRGTVSEYRDVYKNAESEFGVTEHQNQYEKSKKALALAESTLSALPSSINASSNRVLTQDQRERAYNILSDRFMRNRDLKQTQVATYENAWKQARENQATYAKAEIAGQYAKLGDYNNAWVNSINEFTNAAKKLTEGKVALMNWESDYRSWQHNQASLAFEQWNANLSSALTRYLEAMRTESAIRETESMKRQADREAQLAYQKDQLAQKLVNLHHAQQNAKQTQSVINAGGILGRLAYAVNR